MSESVNKNIRISVDSKGVKRGTDEARHHLGKFGKDAKKTARESKQHVGGIGKAFGALGKTLAGLGAGFSAFQLLKFADELSLVESRVRRFTDSEEELIEVQARLRASAKQTYTEYSTVANLYSRLATVTKELGFTQDQIITIGTGLNQTFRLSGASAQEAASSVLQLTQGLGAGALKGDEFRSIQEGNIVLLQLIADELGVATGAMKQMATEGKITSDVIANALIKNIDQLNEEAGSLATTSSQAFANLKTEFGELVELMNNMTEATAGISNIILEFAQYLNDNQEALVGFATGLQIFAEGISTFFKKLVLTIKTFIESPFEALKVVLLDFLSYMEAGFRILDQHTFLPGMDALADKMELMKKQIGTTAESTREYQREMRELDLLQQKNVLTLLAQREATIDLIETRRALGKKGGGAEEVKLQKTALEQYTKAIEEHITKFKLLDSGYASYIEHIHKLQVALREGQITQSEFTQAVEESAQAYHDSVNKLDDNKVKSYVEELQDSIDGFARDASQSFADFVTQGKVDFADFANSIINDMIRITAQKLIFDKAFQGFSGLLDSFGGGAETTANAHGNVYSGGNVIPFKRGGVVDKPTLFPMAKGAGIMGEAGPEGILPLKRNSRGDLGVSASGGMATVVNIQVDNQVQGAQATVEESDDGMGGADIRILFTQIEDHIANRVTTRKGTLFNALHQGGFQGRLR